MAPATHGAIEYVSYQKGIIQGHPGYWCRTIEALGLCSKIVFQPIISLDVSTQTVFLYYMTVTYNLTEYFWWFFMSMLGNGCYAKQTKSKYFWTIHRLNLWEHRWIRVPLLIPVDGFKHSNSSILGSKGIFNRFGCIIWRPNAIFDGNVDIA